MKMVPLGTLADVQLGKMLSPKSKTGQSPFPYLRNQDVQWGRINVTGLPTMDFSDKERAKFELRPGDLLVCEGGEPGRCAVWQGEIEHCYFQKALHRIRPNAGRIDTEFLMYCLRYQAATGAFEHQNAKTTIAHLPLTRLRQVLVPNISVGEQRRIVKRLKAQLTAAEDARVASTSQISDALKLSELLHRQAFRGIVPISTLSDHTDTPCGWLWRPIRNLARLESGHTPSRSRPDWWGGDVSWISLTEIRRLDGRWTEETRIKTNPDGIAHSAARILPRGTVCLSRTASVGFVTIMANPMATSQDFANWVCGDALDPEFLMYALICSREHLRSLATGATHKTIYMPTLEQFRICAPPRPEQERIVRRLRDQLAVAESARLAAEAQLREIQLLPERILATAFGDGERAA